MADSNTTVEILQMSKEAYQLFDTTIKIGLGALISGIVTYITTKMNHKHEINKLEKNHEKEINKLEKNIESEVNKYKLQMKIEIIKEVQQIVSDYMIACENFSDILMNFKNRKFTTIIEVQKYDSGLYDLFIEYKDILLIEIPKAKKASRKLKSVGFYNSEEKLYALSKLVVSEYNKTNKYDNILLNHEDFEEYQTKLREFQNDYFIALNKDIEKLK